MSALRSKVLYKGTAGMKVLAIIQARLGSERLPNKVLLQIPKESGVSMLEMVIRKTLLATKVDKIAVVTPDRKLAEIVDTLFPNIIFYVKGWPGRDVLREIYEAAKYERNKWIEEPEIIVRLTADCPLLNSEEIDHCIDMFIKSNVDIVYNTDESTGQLNGEGSDVEAFSYESLEKAYWEAETPQEREHPTLWIRRNCRTLFVPCRKLGILSVNTQDEYEKVCGIVRNS